MSTRKEIAEAFKAAKGLLARNERDCSRGLEGFICMALRRSKHPASHRAEEIVMQRIAPRSTVIAWLDEAHGVPYPATNERLAYRHLWLDELIKEFSS